MTDPDTAAPRVVVRARLVEAREYLGVTVQQAAGALGWPADRLLALESGDTVTPSGADVRRLARLYRRPVAWLCGETTFQPSPEMLRQVEKLSAGDREAVLDFAEFLEGADPAPEVARG